MAMVPKRMGTPTLLTTSDVTYYTAAANEVLSNILLTNVTGSPVTVSVAVVTPGISGLGDAFRIAKNVQIDAYGMLHLTELRIPLASGDFISASASVGAAVNIRSTGVSL